jgi:hypothetical protein
MRFVGRDYAARAGCCSLLQHRSGCLSWAAQPLCFLEQSVHVTSFNQSISVMGSGGKQLVAGSAAVHNIAYSAAPCSHASSVVGINGQLRDGCDPSALLSSVEAVLRSAHADDVGRACMQMLIVTAAVHLRADRRRERGHELCHRAGGAGIGG